MKQNLPNQKSRAKYIGSLIIVVLAIASIFAMHRLDDVEKSSFSSKSLLETLPPEDAPTLIHPLYTYGPRVELQPGFTWETVNGAAEYEFRVLHGDDFTDVVMDTILEDTVLAFPFELNEGDFYRWQVRAVNEGGPGPWSHPILFRTLFDDGYFDPAGLYLTWQQDPATTMTIDWHTIPRDGERESVIQYRKTGEDAWNTAGGASHAFPNSDRIIHRVEITGLEPATMYDFHFGEDSKEYRFRTMPGNLDGEPVIFATGGDVMFTPERMDSTLIEVGQQRMEKTNRMVMAYARDHGDIDFISWGGDLAYDDGELEKAYRNYAFFDTIKETLIDDDGRVIPIIVSTGNHEVLRSYTYNYDDFVQTDEWRAENAPFFFSLFAFPGQPGYGVLDFGDYMSKISLDTEHTNPIEGAQLDWLENVLAERTEIPYVFPFYHVPAFPSHRWDTDQAVSSVQAHFPPMFEKYGVRVVFENHDHAYKRTWPIRDGMPSEDGIIYVGDGAWGIHLRDGRRSDEWYIHKFESARHAIIVKLDGESIDMVMLNEDGEIIDTYNSNDPVELPPPPAPEEAPVTIHPLNSHTPRVELQPEFSWEPVPLALEYQVQLAKGNFSNMIMDSTLQETTLAYPYELDPGELYRWQVRASNEGGSGPWSDQIAFRTIEPEPTSGREEGSNIPAEYMLGHNYPNPFNPVTTITYGLPVTSHVILRVYDLIGREIMMLVNEEQSAGHHTVVFDSRTLGSGVYLYRITATPAGESGSDIFTQTNSMTLIK